MKLEQTHWNGTRWKPGPNGMGDRARLVWVFGGSKSLLEGTVLAELKNSYPNAHLVGCSTAGEICGIRVHDDTIVATALEFESATVATATLSIEDASESRKVGRELAGRLDHAGLVHVVVLSDGMNVNGSDLVAGLSEALPPAVSLTGGLSADGDRFQSTQVLCDGPPTSNQVVAIGFYGAGLKVGFGSLGGWDAFGPERLVTRSKGNVLFELDGKSALELYKQYLGEHASELPASGLLFPLSIRSTDIDKPVVRTILAVDESAKTMTFAGDIPQGSYATLMKANFDRLIDGAAGAARTCGTDISQQSAEFALLISCVGRKLLLKQRIEEEVEAVRDVLGEDTILTGFYSYGEISPFAPEAKCELHNQTMTITTFSEN